MKKKGWTKFQVIAIPFSILSTALVLMCYFLLQFLDAIVHGDLYRFGLVFSYEWASQYWNYSALIRDSIQISLVIIFLALVFVIIYNLSRKNSVKLISSFLIAARIFFIIFSFFSLLQLDYLVNNFLYNYGLQFSYDWAGPYWSILVLFFGLFIAIIFIDTVSILFLISSESWFYKGIKLVFRVNSLLFLVGLGVLFLSVNFNSTILVFIGLGCVFWGVILINVKSSKYVKEDLLLTATPSLMTSLRKIILELGYRGQPIYLPPKYLQDFESSKVFINKTSKKILTFKDDIQETDTVFRKNPDGLIITPPGFNLCKLFEETLQTNFTQKDLAFFEANLRKLIVENLEIAQNIQLNKTENLIHIKIENSVYGNTGILSSAIACVLAKTTNNLLIIENRETSKNGKIIDIYYRLFESPSS